MVGLVGVTAGLISAGTLLGGAIGATASVGVRFRSGVGIGLIDYAPSPLPDSSVQLYALGVGVRFGNQSQLTLAALPTLSVVTTKDLKNTVTGSAFGVTAMAQGALVVIEVITLFAQTSLGVDVTGGVTFALSGGVASASERSERGYSSGETSRSRAPSRTAGCSSTIPSASQGRRRQPALLQRAPGGAGPREAPL